MTALNSFELNSLCDTNILDNLLFEPRVSRTMSDLPSIRRIVQEAALV